jgi:hypothetical protein
MPSDDASANHERSQDNNGVNTNGAVGKYRASQPNVSSMRRQPRTRHERTTTTRSSTEARETARRTRSKSSSARARAGRAPRGRACRTARTAGR